jgi:hypothetical protein
MAEHPDIKWGPGMYTKLARFFNGVVLFTSPHYNYNYIFVIPGTNPTIESYKSSVVKIFNRYIFIYLFS